MYRLTSNPLGEKQSDLVLPRQEVQKENAEKVRNEINRSDVGDGVRESGC